MILPITFSIPKEKVVNTVPLKSKVLAHIIPGDRSTYIYDNEEDYYKDYQTSLFALTVKKAGWDCLRHYEILANGCIPVFADLEECPPNTLSLLPKKLLLDGNVLFSQLKNKSLKELTPDEVSRCDHLIQKLLNHTKDHLLTTKVANYILKKTQHNNVRKILYLSGDIRPDYLRCLTLHGFKSLFGSACHDYPHIPHIYKGESAVYIPSAVWWAGNNDWGTDIASAMHSHARRPRHYSHLYGKGMTYTNLLDENLHDPKLDNTIEEDIKNRHYDIIIYGGYTRGMPLYTLIEQHYKPNEIILLHGEDSGCREAPEWWMGRHYGAREHSAKGHYIFVREL